MKRSLSLLAFAVFAAACSSSPGTGKSGGAQTGAGNDHPAGHDDGGSGQGSSGQGQGDDPSGTDDPTEQGGDDDGGLVGGNDAGNDAGSVGSDGGSATDGAEGGVDGGVGATCPAAAKGWRAMASASGVSLVALSGFVPSAARQEAVWTGHEVLALAGDASCAHYPCSPLAVAYDPAKDAWRSVAAPPAINPSYTRWTGDRWLVVGNVPGTDTLVVEAYDPTTNAWSTFATPPLSGRTAVAVAWATTTHELLLWGGGHNMSVVYSDGSALNPATGVWRPMSASPLSARADAAASWDGARMVIVGGGVWIPGKGDGDVFNENAVADGAAYDPVTNTWTALPTPAFTPRMEASAVSLRTGESFVFGGDAHNTDNESGTPLWDGARMDVGASAWTAVSPPPIDIPAGPTSGRYGSTMVAGDGAFFVWGGARVDGTMPDFADGARFDVTTGAWTKLPSGGPSSRYQAIGVWTGCDLMVYGGQANGTAGVLQSGMMYRP